MKKKFTDKIFQKIKDTNSKENPFNIDEYDHKTIKDWHQLKENIAKYFWVSFTCKSCGKKTIKHIDNHFESRYTETTLVNCEQCNRKASLINSIGCDNPFKSKRIQKKIKQTNLKKYGADNPAKSKEIQNKIKNTNIEKYGVENVFQNEQIKEKIKQTNLKKYGVDNPNKSDKIKEKKKNTILKKYGVDHYSKTKEYKKKFKDTMITKYGVEHAIQSKQVLDKVKQTCLERYGVENYTKSDQYKEYMLETYGTLSVKHHYAYNNIVFDSSWELAFYIYHIDMGYHIEHEPICFEYFVNKNLHLYFPDFKVGNKYYELKGEQFIVRYKNGNIKTLICSFNRELDPIYNAKYKCMKKHNVTIIDKNEIKKYLNYIDKTYGKNYLKEFKINKKEKEKEKEKKENEC